jgi:hypothetical protein
MESETATSYHSKEQTGLTASNVTSFFHPDTVLSAQFFDDRRSITLLEPEKRLMLAILEDAIDCFAIIAQQSREKRNGFSTMRRHGSSGAMIGFSGFKTSVVSWG